VEHQNIEIQQRACEFLRLFEENWDQHRIGIFEPMPFQGDENMLVDATERAVREEGEGDDNDLIRIDKKEAEYHAPKPQVEKMIEDDPLDIFGIIDDSAPNDNPNDIFDPLELFNEETKTGENISSSNNTDIFNQNPSNLGRSAFDDIFESDGFGVSQPAKPSPPSYLAYEDGNIKVTLTFERQSGDASKHKITAHYSNKTSSTLDQINMQVSVKKYLTIHLYGVSNPTLPPNSPPVTQQMDIYNTKEGTSPIVLKAKITYINTSTGSKVVETKVLDNLPLDY
jgi:hypothetical protein